MWLFLWVVFVLAAIGFFLWSYHAIYEQKRAWKAFSEKYNLQYFGGKMMDSPSMTGQIKGYDFNFYPQIVENVQGQRQTQNIVEIFLNTVPDMISVVATPGFSDFVTVLDLPEPFHVDDPEWPTYVLSRTFPNEDPVSWFMNEKQRLAALQKLTKLPFDWAFFSDAERAFIALRTPNSLADPAKLNKLVGVLMDVTKMLEKYPVVTDGNSETVQESEALDD